MTIFESDVIREILRDLAWALKNVGVSA